MLTKSLPFLPIILPRPMYFERLLFTLPRTIFRKRCRSRSIFCPTIDRLFRNVGRSSLAGVRPERRLTGLGDSGIRERGEGWGYPEPRSPYTYGCTFRPDQVHDLLPVR